MSQTIYQLLQHIIDCCRSYLDEHSEAPSLFDHIIEEAIEALPEAAPVQDPADPSRRRRSPKSYNAKKLGLIATDRLVEKIHKNTGFSRESVREVMWQKIDELGIKTELRGTHKYITIAAGEYIERNINK